MSAQDSAIDLRIEAHRQHRARMGTTLDCDLETVLPCGTCTFNPMARDAPLNRTGDEWARVNAHRARAAETLPMGSDEKLLCQTSPPLTDGARCTRCGYEAPGHDPATCADCRGRAERAEQRRAEDERAAMARQDTADIYRRQDEKIAQAQAAVRAAHHRLERVLAALEEARTEAGGPQRRTSDVLNRTRALVRADALRRIRDEITQHRNNPDPYASVAACFDRLTAMVNEGLGLEGGS